MGPTCVHDRSGAGGQRQRRRLRFAWHPHRKKQPKKNVTRRLIHRMQQRLRPSRRQCTQFPQAPEPATKPGQGKPQFTCDSCTFRSTCSLGTSGVACNCTHRSTADRINNTCHTSHAMHFPERAISSEFSQLHPLLVQKARIPDGSLSHNSRTKRKTKATGNGSRVAERDAENFTAENSRRLGLRLVEVRIETHGKLRLVSVSAEGNEENSSPCPHTKFHTIFTAPPATTFPVPCVSPNSRRCELPLAARLRRLLWIFRGAQTTNNTRVNSADKTTLQSKDFHWLPRVLLLRCSSIDVGGRRGAPDSLPNVTHKG